MDFGGRSTSVFVRGRPANDVVAVGGGGGGDVSGETDDAVLNWDSTSTEPDSVKLTGII